MKYRVERERTDHGYGAGWVVLNPEGDAFTMSGMSWRTAYQIAIRCAQYRIERERVGIRS